VVRHDFIWRENYLVRSDFFDGQIFIVARNFNFWSDRVQ
jgi:hypothetical protein